MAAPVRTWPTISEYDIAFKDTAKNVYDPDIKQTKLLGDARPFRLNSIDKYVSVYKMDAISKKEAWVVRCFFTKDDKITPPPDIEERYQKINNYIAAHQSELQFLVNQKWVQHAVGIEGQIWPFIKSNFISNSQNLGEFLEEHYTEKQVISALAKQFLTIIKTLESLEMAHGDLDITNLLVCGTSPNVRLQLVDFDCMYVPALQGKSLYENGHAHFQPPQKNIRRFDQTMDRFSALVIYLSLLALSENPPLWKQCKANETTKLLLGANDFQNLNASPAYALLRAQNNQLLQKCLRELDLSIKDQHMPNPLFAIINEKFVPSRPKTQTQRPPMMTTDVYQAPSIPMPLEFLQNQQSTPTPPSSVTPSLPLPIPVPVDFLQQPSRVYTGNTQQQPAYNPPSNGGQQQQPAYNPPSNSGQQQQFAPQTSRTKMRPLSWWLLIGTIVAFVFAIGSNLWEWYVIALILLIFFFVSLRKRKNNPSS